jgi:hypothetical protein
MFIIFVGKIIIKQISLKIIVPCHNNILPFNKKKISRKKNSLIIHISGNLKQETSLIKNIQLRVIVE